MTRIIPNSELSLQDLPPDNAPWDLLAEFALTFQGSNILDSGTIANDRLHDTLSNLRTCLRFEQRRYRHMGAEPTGDELEYMQSLIFKIRAKLLTNDRT
jgi:hypothetical protein